MNASPHADKEWQKEMNDLFFIGFLYATALEKCWRLKARCQKDRVQKENNIVRTINQIAQYTKGDRAKIILFQHLKSDVLNILLGSF